MTPGAILLVRQSWRALEPMGPELMAALSTRLVELDPAFGNHLAAGYPALEARRLADAVSSLVGCLDAPEKLVTMAAGLGRGTADAGLTSRHFDLLGEALLGTLRSSLEPAWNLELHDAWAEAYILVASIMKRASARASGEYVPGLPASH